MNALLPATACPYIAEDAPPDGSPEWLQMRTRGIGGSDAAAVLGLSKWKTPYDVYLDKRGLSDPIPSNRAMRLGSAMEPIILSEYAAEVNVNVSKPKQMFFSKECPWMLVNLDGLRHDDGRVVEAKRSDNPDFWGPTGSDSYPEEYFMQVQHAMFVMSVPVADLVVLLPRNDLRIYTIPADKSIQSALVDGEREFWQGHVLAGNPPPVDFTHPGATNAMRALFNGMEGDLELPGDPELLAAIAAHKHAGDLIKELEAEKEASLALVMSRAGNARKCRVDGWPGTITRAAIAEGYVSYARKARIDTKINHPRRKA